MGGFMNFLVFFEPCAYGKQVNTSHDVFNPGSGYTARELTYGGNTFCFSVANCLGSEDSTLAVATSTTPMETLTSDIHPGTQLLILGTAAAIAIKAAVIGSVPTISSFSSSPSFVLSLPDPRRSPGTSVTLHRSSSTMAPSQAPRPSLVPPR